GVGQQALQLSVLIFQGAQTLGVRHAHPAELGLPGVDRALGHAVLARQLARFGAGLVLPQDPDDLLFRESRSFHSVRPFKARTLAPRGGNSQGHVTTARAAGGVTATSSKTRRSRWPQDAP